MKFLTVALAAQGKNDAAADVVIRAIEDFGKDNARWTSTFARDPRLKPVFNTPRLKALLANE